MLKRVFCLRVIIGVVLRGGNDTENHNLVLRRFQRRLKIFLSNFIDGDFDKILTPNTFVNHLFREKEVFPSTVGERQESDKGLVAVLVLLRE